MKKCYINKVYNNNNNINNNNNNIKNRVHNKITKIQILKLLTVVTSLLTDIHGT